MSHTHHDQIEVPKGALIMAAALVGIALLLTASVRLGLLSPEAVPAAERAAAGAEIVASRSLQFYDQPDGAVRIEDTETGETLQLIESETEGGGFIRGVMRGLARERRLRGVGDVAPFSLTLWEDGSLSLRDVATGRTIEIGAFGPDNRATFAALLPRGDA